jgi:hypothetical protein
MYGFSGYATNEYGTPRRMVNAFGPVFKLAMRAIRNTYGIGKVLMLGFKNTTLTP